MRLKRPKTWADRKRELLALWPYAAILLFLAVAFLGGMLFDRSGIPARILGGLGSNGETASTPQAVATNGAGARPAPTEEAAPSNGLATLALELPVTSLGALESRWETALETGILLTFDEEFVPGQLRYNDAQNLAVEVRLQTSDNPPDEKKWPLQVRVTEPESTVAGMQQFSLHSPPPGGALQAWGYYQNLRREGVAAARYLLVDLVINGEPGGIYALTENLTTADDALENNSQTLTAQELAAWGKYFAVRDLWGLDGNPQYDYQTTTVGVAPIAVDYDRITINPARLSAYPFYAPPPFDVLGVQKAYLETLVRITQPAYLATLQAEFGGEIDQLQRLLAEEFPAATEANEQKTWSEIFWEQLNNRADLLARNLSPEQPVWASYHFVEAGELAVQVDLLNLMVLPVQLNELAFGEKVLELDPGWCVSENCPTAITTNGGKLILLPNQMPNTEPVSFRIPLDDIYWDFITVGAQTLHVQLYGDSQQYLIPLSSTDTPMDLHTGIKPTATLAEALAKHEFLTLAAERQLAIEPGDWNVSGDLVLPEGYDLTIPAGTTLRFGVNNIVLVHGAVDMHGTAAAPILLTAKATQWSGMIVIGAQNTSTWQHVTVEKTAGLPDFTYPGWIITGGITFYESDVEITNSTIGNNFTEDALNVIRAWLLMDQVEFLNTPSDAFDGDFITGTITNSRFHDISGDAIDVSGSELAVTETVITNIGDKAVSVGEASRATLDNLTIQDVNIGVASKDLSAVVLENSSIDGAHFAALAAYIKKPQYGPAQIEARHTEILNADTLAICQTDSRIRLNDEIIPTEDINVDLLYSQKQLGN